MTHSVTAVRVRFAPSPTGYLHIGGLRTALYNYLFARAQGGRFILRIEDTDQSRLEPGAIENLINTLKIMGLDYDEGPGIGGAFAPYIQSQRLSIYQGYAQRLLEHGDAYRCFCSAQTLEDMRVGQKERGEFAKYDRRCLHLNQSEIAGKLAAGQPSVIRLRMPDQHRFGFDDIIRGTVEMDSAQSDDQVLIKSDGFPTYHLAAVVDDHEMEITHVIRGEEWLSSTPKHIWLYQCLGWTTPRWVHLPLILNPDRSKLSKRMNDVSVESYLQRGYLKEALINFVALLGWHGADDRELYTLHELIEAFSLDRVNKSGAVFALTKLDWMNGQYIRSTDLTELCSLCQSSFTERCMDVSDQDKYRRVVDLARKYATLLPEIAAYAEIYYHTKSITDAEMELLRTESAQVVIATLYHLLQSLPRWEIPGFAPVIDQVISTTGIKGKIFYFPIRIALISQSSGPDLPLILNAMGREETLQRLRNALT